MTNQNHKIPNSIWRINSVMEKTGFCRAWIYMLMKDGKFPQARKIGKRAVGWSSLEVQAWIDEQLEVEA